MIFISNTESHPCLPQSTPHTSTVQNCSRVNKVCKICPLAHWVILSLYMYTLYIVYTQKKNINN